MYFIFIVYELLRSTEYSNFSIEYAMSREIPAPDLLPPRPPKTDWPALPALSVTRSRWRGWRRSQA